MNEELRRERVKAKMVQGQRSPRWALWSKMTIPCENGLLYLARLRIIQTPWFGVYVHDIYEPDGDRDPHNHPWSFISIILKGWYHETVYPSPGLLSQDYFSVPVETHFWKRFSFHRMGRDSAHRITGVGPGLKTLILVGPRRGNWGFFTKDGFKPWQDYEKEYHSEQK